MSAETDAQEFAVRFQHRLIFTDDLFAREPETLSALFESESKLPARVQFWLDDGLVELPSAVSRFVAKCGRSISHAGTFCCPGGELVKNEWCHVERMLGKINDEQLDRRSYVVVVGGGAVLDAVGFAAATAHRGIRLIRLPTTTLAQADSGVGVKNAVNRFGKKNWLGTFAVPWAVINDRTLLATLPDHLFREGFSEAVKVTVLKSPALFSVLEASAAAIYRREPEASEEAIRISARLHLAHITKGGDPFEAQEARPLDYGHWLAHRLEAVTGFRVSHGEAVSIGVALDTVYSTLRHGFPPKALVRVLHTLRRLGLPVYHELFEQPEPLFTGLEEFRQHLGGRLTVTMLEDIGRPLDVHEVDGDAMRHAMTVLRHLHAGRPVQLTAEGRELRLE